MMHKITAKEETTLLALLARAGYSRTRVKQVLKHRGISVGGVPVSRPDHPLRPGDVVSIRSDKEMGDGTLQCPGLVVVYEDEEIIVIDKPAGLLTIASATEKVKTAYYRLTNCLKERSGGRERIFIVHRLDQGTSGLLVFARNESVKRALQDGWAAAEKRYRVIVEGVPQEKKGRIAGYLRESKALRVYSVPEGSEEAKYAETGYEVVKEGNGCALLDVTLITGRKNQIRVHMADMGHPVVGDKKYGAKTDPLGRLGLHAGYLAFPHPVSGRRLEFTSPLPAKFHALFKMRSKE
jgi:23S rRNA pseudouridine1911/1915/1917 synthase